MSEASFSFQELRAAPRVEAPRPTLLTASDGVSLAVRRFVPAAPRAAVVFYHGGGAHSAAGYQFLGHGLYRHFDTVVYLPDIRGHGASGGARGDAPSPEQVWADITTVIKSLRAIFPSLPLFLGGHSSGAGLVLNYASQAGHEPIDGYVFLAPQLGARAHTERPALAAPFATVDRAAFAAHARSGGAAFGHHHAVRFNYPAAVLAADPGLVASITVNMSQALTPWAPAAQFAQLDRSFGLWIGTADELFLPDAVLAFADLARSVRSTSEAHSIPNAKHLSILVRAHETMGPWMARTACGKPNTPRHATHVCGFVRYNLWS